MRQKPNFQLIGTGAGRRLRSSYGGRTAAFEGNAIAQYGTSERALYVIDANGIVRWAYVSPVGLNPGANGILDALESLD